VRSRDLERVDTRLPGVLDGEPPKGTGQALLKFAGILTQEEAEQMFGPIMADRARSINDPD